MKTGRSIQLLVNTRYYKAGEIGKIHEVLSEEAASVNLAWNDPNKAPHLIFIDRKNEDEMWKFVS